MIGMDSVFSALMVITLLMIVASVPSIVLSTRGSATLLKKYLTLRKLKDVDDSEIPENIVNEWNAVKSNLSFATVIMEELERMNNLKPAIFQAEVAIILGIVMAFYPGYESDVLVLMIVLILVAIAALIYGYLNIKKYGIAYLEIIKEMSTEGEIANDNMYG